MYIVIIDLVNEEDWIFVVMVEWGGLFFVILSIFFCFWDMFEFVMEYLIE